MSHMSCPLWRDASQILTFMTSEPMPRLRVVVADEKGGSSALAQWHIHAKRVCEADHTNRKIIASRPGSDAAAACGVGIKMAQEEPSAPVRISAISGALQYDLAQDDLAVGDVVLAIDGKALLDVAMGPALCRGQKDTCVVLLLGYPDGLARNSVTLVRHRENATSPQTSRPSSSSAVLNAGHALTPVLKRKAVAFEP